MSIKQERTSLTTGAINTDIRKNSLVPTTSVAIKSEKDVKQPQASNDTHFTNDADAIVSLLSLKSISS
jgi:hypothetical protein